MVVPRIISKNRPVRLKQNQRATNQTHPPMHPRLQEPHIQPNPRVLEQHIQPNPTCNASQRATSPTCPCMIHDQTVSNPTQHATQSNDSLARQSILDYFSQTPTPCIQFIARAPAAGDPSGGRRWRRPSPKKEERRMTKRQLLLGRNGYKQKGAGRGGTRKSARSASRPTRQSGTAFAFIHGP